MSSAVIQRIKLASAKRALQLQSQTLYNASDEVVDFTVGGDPAGCFPFRIPPDGPGTNDAGEDEMCDGLLKVYDIYGVDPAVLAVAKKEGRATASLPRNKLLLSAVTIIEHAIKKLERRGVTVLTGDPAEDEILKAEARKAWIEFRKGTAEATIKRYRERVHAFNRDPGNAGMPAPRMEEHENRAQMWLDEHRLGNIGYKKFVCTVRECGFQADLAPVMERHMLASHPFAAEAERTEQALRTHAAQPDQAPAGADTTSEDDPAELRKRIAALEQQLGEKKASKRKQKAEQPAA